MRIAGREIGDEQPMYVIAELSANHQQKLPRAKELVRQAAAAGADAVKLQTYTPDTLTIRSDQPWFRIGEGTLWTGRTLHDLYGEANTPWEWHAELFDEARAAGLSCFSSPFDKTAVDFLDRLGAPAFKIASFECVDLELIAYAASKGKPLIISTGMATAEEIAQAVATARKAGCKQLALLRCNSAYPATPSEMDLRTIPDMRSRFGVPIGLSDHTLGPASALAARALGACILEKHITLRRADGGPDGAFSTEPQELKELIGLVRTAEQALGKVRYGPTAHEKPSLVFRRSLFTVADIAAGQTLTRENVRCIRPGHGLAPAELPNVLGRKAKRAIARGTPLSWDLVE